VAKRALITGITGQDGSYLAELLLGKGYEVHGIIRRSSSFNTERIDPIYKDRHDKGARLFLHYGDLSDPSSLIKILGETQPEEIYNLAAQSHVRVSFDIPEFTGDVTAIGTVRLLDAMRQVAPKARFYQASSSEMYGLVQAVPQNETTPFYPRSPYAAAKVYSHWITVNYRESYGMHASCGILFNHESPRRGETFVTRKITRALARIALGQQDCLYLGNLSSLRDWGHARDYVQMQWLMLQQATPDDYVIATGRQASVRDFVNLAAARLGMTLDWRGFGVAEVAVVDDAGEHEGVRPGQVIVRVDPRYFRPAEVDTLLGDAGKARERLGWQPTTTLAELVSDMVDADLAAARKYALVRHHGYLAPAHHE